MPQEHNKNIRSVLWKDAFDMGKDTAISVMCEATY